MSDPYFTRPLTATEASRPLTAAELADPSLGACKRMHPGCRELGPYKPFYQGYVCDFCLHLDSEDVKAHRNPPGDMGVGTLFRREGEP